MPLLVTHNAPDLDAITSIWLLTRFDSQHYSGSRITFVNAGETISLEAAAALGYNLDQVTHVDTGGGDFDHHDVNRSGKEFCAAKLVFDYLKKIHPEIEQNFALIEIVKHVLEVDHFGEVFWPESNHPRYQFMLHEIIAGIDRTETNDDTYQVELGARLLDYIYAGMKSYLQARAELANGIVFPLKSGTAFAILSSNEEVLAAAQKNGHLLAIKKDEQLGNIRIKARPDANFNLEQIYQAIKLKDNVGTWYYHPSGKMLLNGSRKNINQKPSPLTLEEIIVIVKDYLG